jgi:putative pyoverdin transport system ATP-binding/permease protein
MNLRLLLFIKEEAKELWLKIFLASIVSGLANGVVVVIVNAAARGSYQFNMRYFFLFAICMAVYLITFKYSYFQIATVLRNAMAKTHLRIADRLRHADLLSFEGIGQNRISRTLSENSEIIIEASRMITVASSSSIMLVFTFGYMAYLSRIAFFMAAILILCAVVIYMRNQNMINQLMSTAIQKESEFFNTVNHLLAGFKEIKMNRSKSDDIFHNYLNEIAHRVKDLRIGSEAKFLSNILFSQGFWYFLLAAIVFLLPKIGHVENEKIVGLTMVVLFIMGPLGAIVTAIPLVVKANFAIDQLDVLEKELSTADDLKETHPDNPFTAPSGICRIEFKNIIFTYPAPPGQDSFSIGPIDLKIKKGEILFLIGGNGSGKTTLLKVITGLYYPQQGTVLMDGLAVNKANYQHYRDEMAVIFSDFHLFDRLYGLKEVDLERLRDALRSMALMDKTAYVDGRFTNLNLSSGQKRRLALITALMEDKPILVVDELAADLDPEFRKYFYEVILVDLKSKGKTIIATSHDDRYFHVADRVVKMEYGRINDGD